MSITVPVILSVRGVSNVDFSTEGHHPQVLFQLISGKIDHMIGTQLVDYEHRL